LAGEERIPVLTKTVDKKNIQCGCPLENKTLNDEYLDNFKNENFFDNLEWMKTQFDKNFKDLIIKELRKDLENFEENIEKLKWFFSNEELKEIINEIKPRTFWDYFSPEELKNINNGISKKD